jgi:dynein heavy chain
MVEAVADETPDMKWIIFDGPIDALWVENMNTVLDDTCTLCLANSKRIKLKSDMRMVFEVQDLDEASPATVSRLGVVYMNAKDLGWLPLVETWATKYMKHAPPSIMRRIMNNIRTFVQPGIDYIRKKCHEPISSCDSALAVSLTSLLYSILTDNNVSKFIQSLSGSLLDAFIDKIFVFAFVWSIGGPIASEEPFGTEKFNEFLLELFEKGGMPFDLGKYGFKDVFLKFEGEGSFQPWESVVTPLKFDRKLPFFQLMVPTIDTVRYSYILEWLIKVKKPAFLTGITGTGKTIILQDLLSKLSKSTEEGGQDTLPIFIGFSAKSNAKVVQLSIESKLQKNRKNLLGPPVPFKKVVIVVDDVNMPSVEVRKKYIYMLVMRDMIIFINLVKFCFCIPDIWMPTSN